MNRRRSPLLLGIFALISILIPGTFILQQITRGSDRSHVAPTAEAFGPSGVRVVPYHGLDPPFPPGSIITAVDGKSMESWAEAVLRPGVDRPPWRPGDSHTYTLRLPDGREQRLQIKLSEIPVRSILRSRWGVLVFAAISQVIGAFILWRRPYQPAAQALFIWALMGSHTYAWSFPLQVGDLVGALGFWLSFIATALMWVLYFAASVHMALVFPRPVAIFRQRSKAPILIYLGAIAIFLAAIFYGRLSSENSLAWFRWWSLAGDLVAALGLFATLGIIIGRYRTHLSAEERARVRWAVYGASISGSLGLFLWILAPRIFDIQIMSANTLGLLMVIFPVSLGIAIWRHRLFDIDLIIRRTLVYASLSALLLGIYFLSVVALQTIFRSGLSDTSPLTVVLSTLAAAALFSPLHSRVQRFIDRRFYRQKYDASRTLARFAESAQEQLNLQQLVEELRAVVIDTMQPDQVSIWLSGDSLAEE